MATRKTSTRKPGTRRTTRKAPSKRVSQKSAGKMPASAAFWIFLLIVMVIAFFMLLPRLGVGNREQITENREQGTGEDEGTNSNSKEQVANSKGTEEKKPQAEKTAAPEQKEPEKKPEAEKPQVEKSAEQTTAKPQTQPEKKPQAEKTAAPEQKSPEQKPTTPPPVSTPPVKPVETRDRSIYLIQKSNDGVLVLVRVNRKLNVTKTPLLDSINALLAGPAPDEIMRGIESFVPEGSRLIKAPDIIGSTAVLDFNKEFTYNTRGSEGCAAQIKQIVWTATEISPVRNVQFLIDGNEVDFLSEGVPIRRPIGR